ncbi:MAG: transcription antitermination factor NusB [Bacilli bacterium]|nr:transcription antitermination factor NusB [Bacilli bacterium]MDY6430652.1 transcription antitermination factor NusB [Bacilli bacterium]
MQNNIENELENELSSRNSLQKIALFCLYDILVYKEVDKEIDVVDIISSLCECGYDEAPIFVKSIVINALKHFEYEIKTIEPFLTKWSFFRLNRLAQAILLLSFTHFFYVEEDVNKRIVINIAVKFAKLYLDANDYKYINAVLDKVLVR